MRNFGVFQKIPRPHLFYRAEAVDMGYFLAAHFLAAHFTVAYKVR